MIDLAVVVAALVVWFGIYAFCRVLTRPMLPHPAPATMDLGPESPALVSLLVNRWHLTEDASESTLLDLAARKFFELRQPGNDPMQTTVHVPATGPDGSGLKPYESQVLERIRRLAVGGVVPITALTFAAVSLGVLCARPGEGLMAVVSAGPNRIDVLVRGRYRVDHAAPLLLSHLGSPIDADVRGHLGLFAR